MSKAQLCRAAALLPVPPLCCPQDAGRRVAFYTLSHVLGLDLQFHLNRKTGEQCRWLQLAGSHILALACCGAAALLAVAQQQCCPAVSLCPPNTQAPYRACWSGGPGASP